MKNNPSKNLSFPDFFIKWDKNKNKKRSLFQVINIEGLNYPNSVNSFGLVNFIWGILRDFVNDGKVYLCFWIRVYVLLLLEIYYDTALLG